MKLSVGRRPRNRLRVADNTGDRIAVRVTVQDRRPSTNTGAGPMESVGSLRSVTDGVTDWLAALVEAMPDLLLVGPTRRRRIRRSLPDGYGGSSTMSSRPIP
jgi:hypothetical protein